MKNLANLGSSARSALPIALTCALALGLLGACDGGGGGRTRDAGPTTTDAGPTTTDAGPVMTDAGPVMTDAGPPPVDAGPPSSCVDVSEPTIMCDPRLGECDGPGSSCDVANGPAGFPDHTECFPPPNDTPVGETCGDTAFCVPGSHCHVDTCRSFCCADTECPTGFYCDRIQFTGVVGAESLGLCLPM